MRSRPRRPPPLRHAAWTVGAALLWALVVGPASLCNADTLPSPSIGGRPGSWQVGSFAGALTPMKGRAGSRTLAYSLPAGTVQGRPLWYLVRLHATVGLPRANGSYLLSVDTNGYTCLQVEYTVHAGATTVDSLDLVSGRRIVQARGAMSSVDLQNYLQVRGVQAGRNTWAVRWETLRGPGASWVHVAADSGILATVVRPDELGLQVSRGPLAVRVGSDVALPYRLVRRGGRPDRPLSVQLQRTGGGLVATGPIEQRLPGIGTGRGGEFRLRGAAPGTYVLVVKVADAYNSPAALVTVVVQPKTRRQLNVPVVLTLGASGVLGAAGRAGWRRRRSQGAGRVPAG